MVCKKCGTEIAEDALFCAHCGEKIENTECAEETTAVETVAAKKNEETEEKPTVPAGATPVLVWGIVSLVCSLSTFSVNLLGPLMGVIFGAISKKLAKAYIKKNGDVSTRVRVGRGLATGGLWVGIVLLAIEVISLLLSIAGVLLGLLSTLVGIFAPILLGILSIVAGIFSVIGVSGVEAFVYSLMDMVQNFLYTLM